MTSVISTDPATGLARPLGFDETDAAGLADAVAAAERAGERLVSLGRFGRAALLETIADALEARRDEIVGAADSETALGPVRLNGELTRTAYQLRFFAEVLREGSYLEAVIDHAGDTPMGPRPDLRRMLVPIGPVAVYAASNFPLAFSVPGGDTAAALAAGCGVVVKAHPAHPATSALVGSTIADATEPLVGRAVSVVFGYEAGIGLVEAPAIRAASFTGSPGGGRALAELAAARPEPIPFYGELGSINPVLVSPAAAAARASSLAAGLAGSIALGGGQFCTKPGLAFVPAGPDGDELVAELAAQLTSVVPKPALTTGMAAAYASGLESLGAVSGARVLSGRTDAPAPGTTAPSLVEFEGDDLPPRLAEECFGPVAVVARYRDDEHAARLVGSVPGSLTASLFLEPGDSGVPAARAAISARVGRILYDQYPTGVAVAWAQNHGGPWPSTDSVHTSVGATSIRRYLRPVAWQNAPASELPAELRDGPVDLPRRVDGVLVLPGS
ncbi:aldehyde dehydrogenase family protein [Herbiconiux sp. CPCC 203407]|uniref:Aldehyde dehydrogenase family protein n=1 Tax=Herbiconiux oxytropis TaxID=2970915 RepID=A0AA42BTG0_9MICO|nr:aldehyde dehydrogenase family protein [Herbiconiux oxytropis]MCS5722913.1 aldehyde dehydrogenase family protein [Herbiconiux oxytropis]MCS5725827.1 aldehyde dehydrogenase family protein [Herbiconiux oxytropis]